MRLLVLGATGMLGHKLVQVNSQRFDVWAAARSRYLEVAGYGLFDPQRYIGGLDVMDFTSVVRAFAIAKPEAVVNCIGIVKQLPSAKDPITSLSTNSLWPHKLAQLCQATGSRLVHVSTDCVFSGRKGNYTEDDPSDAEDLYGRTKFLGEVSGPGCLTLRTSIIGRELNTSSGLVEWFLGNRGAKVRGFAGAKYSGLTTLALSEIIANLLENHQELSGLYQVASQFITKYQLLQLMNEAYGADIRIEACDDVQLDRTLDGTRFINATGIVPPSWPEMIQQMAADPTPYERWRNSHGS
jgi:dTDP-4-dehydrorhamnose reductase